MNDKMSSNDQEILRNVSTSENFLELSPIFESKLRKFGGLSLTPKIKLKENEFSYGNGSPQTAAKTIYVSEPMDIDQSGKCKCYETPVNCALPILNEKKLKKKCMKPAITRPSCKRLQLPSISASKRFTRLLSKKTPKINALQIEVIVKADNDSKDEQMNFCSPSRNENVNLEVPMLNYPHKWSPISGCSPLSMSSIECIDSHDGDELKLSDFPVVPYVSEMITSTPVDDGGNFDYSISAITEGCEESSCFPFILKETRFCCSSEIIISDTNSQCSLFENSDKENIDPDINRATFDALLRNRRISKFIREDRIKCTYRRIGSKPKPLGELIRISLSASQPVCIAQPVKDNRVSQSQPENRTVKTTLLSCGLDFIDSVNSPVS